MGKIISVILSAIYAATILMGCMLDNTEKTSTPIEFAPTIKNKRTSALSCCNWTRLPGSARDIGSSAGPTLGSARTWKVMTEGFNGGFRQWNWSTFNWDILSGGTNSGVRIDGLATSTTRTLLMVRSSGLVYRKVNSGSWVLEGVPDAIDVAIGGDGTFWALAGVDQNVGGWSGRQLLRKLPGGSWQTWGAGVPFPGGHLGVRVTADAVGNPWVVERSGVVFYGSKTDANQWERCDVAGFLAGDIGASNDPNFPEIWATAKGEFVGDGGLIHKMDARLGEGNWIETNGWANNIDVEGSTLFVTQPSGDTYLGTEF